MKSETTYYHSPIGLIKIATDGDCITEVLFEDKIESKHATHKNKSPLLLHCVEQLIEYFAHQRKVFDLPLQQSGTEFQQQVWACLQQVPFGKTLSYLEFAKKVGDEKAIRAIANANGKNKISIIVSCHRIIGSDGHLVGYAGGLWRKKWLLDMERKVTFGEQSFF